MKSKPDTLAHYPNLAAKLRQAGLRPTRQRMDLAALLFTQGHRHASAEKLFDEVKDAGLSVSLATIYNTLHQFADAGLLRTISIDSNRTYFDTNIGDHHHYFLEESQEIVDIDETIINVDGLPEPPEGTEISRVDVIVHVRKSTRLT